MNSSQNVAVVVISCDKYSDLWEPFFSQFQEIWPECPYDTYLVSNHKTYINENVKMLNLGTDKAWSANLLSVIDRLNQYEYLLLLMEDGFITKVNSENIYIMIEKFVSESGDFLTLVSEPAPSKRETGFYGPISTNSQYRVTATWAVWKAQTLKKLLREEENAWEFEINGSRRSHEYEKIFSVYDDQFEYIHGVIRGLWVPSAAKKIAKLGYAIDLKYRPQMSVKAILYLRLYEIIRRVVLWLTPLFLRKHVVKLKRIFSPR